MKQVLLEAISGHIKEKGIENSQHVFTKGKSCFTNPTDFCDEMTTSVDEGKALDA